MRMRQVIKHRDIRLLNMIRRTDPVILLATMPTRSGMVWAMKVSIFSTFCSIVFLMAPVVKTKIGRAHV